ncbi:ribosomal acidic phosphoprotein P0 [Cavenderia fasciculata]|uniref:Ribosomal acidic phosphoprotein P0 n=1 Tax=Cavenderia fasciculata TaxID=261658 RepID=F4PNB1_CACFS|nr:ribosomal acidic phosphoprotein P0 [Cavenderia fasciculata]EGG22964.1 ribosomal acidic phosphoprotein P0 [Cavenderia fasciculata]|eukprot:XP_004360815.1 ribosomal acidic phosphoprotein P0 [Cavenderia fasciculata]
MIAPRSILANYSSVKYNNNNHHSTTSFQYNNKNQQHNNISYYATSTSTSTTTKKDGMFENLDSKQSMIKEVENPSEGDLYNLRFQNILHFMEKVSAGMTEEEIKTVFPEFTMKQSKVLSQPQPLDWLSDELQSAITNRDYAKLNPYHYIWPASSILTKLRVRWSTWREIIALDRSKLEKKLIAEFHKFWSTVENCDQAKLEEYRKNGTQFPIEKFRDLFHTFKKEGIDYEFVYEDVQVIFSENRVTIPYVTVKAHYFVKASFRVPGGGVGMDKSIPVNFYVPIHWGAILPAYESPESAPEEIDFDKVLEWKPMKLPMVGKIDELAAEKRQLFQDYTEQYFEQVRSNLDIYLAKKYDPKTTSTTDQPQQQQDKDKSSSKSKNAGHYSVVFCKDGFEMSGGASKRKSNFMEKATKLFSTYNKMIIAHADFVGSNQLQKIRVALRGKGAMLMGKKTLVRKCVKSVMESKPELESLIPHLKSNTAVIFAKDSLSEIKEIIKKIRVGAPAKAGVIAPQDVHVPKGPTGLEPTQVNFLQELKIATKINRGQIDIESDIHLIKTGQKVGASEATLLQKLNIKPFTYGLEPLIVYDEGACYSPSISEEDLITKFKSGVANIAGISLAIGYPTVASVPHSVMDAYKSLLAIALTTEITFPAADKFKAALSAAPVAAAPVAAAPAAASAPAAKVKEEPKEESDDDMGMGLFD